ncbi:MAG: DUF2855 family protein [Pseudomonadota bacterium]
MQQLQLGKGDIRQLRLLDGDAQAELGEGEIRVRVEAFAFSANNVTYAAAGHTLGYWKFFKPVATGDGDGSDYDDVNGWGVLPCWGFAEVVETNAADLPLGERFYGYFPTAQELVMKPVHIKEGSFIDGAEHRSELPPGYNFYRRVAAEPGYDRATDELRMLLAPLYITSFCLWDLLQDNNWYGAKQVLIVSASSKTSFGLAYALKDDADAPSVVGLTSSRNVGFVEGVGLYGSTVSYKDIASLDANVPAVIVDMSGNADTMGALHAHFGDALVRSIDVGLTHWDEPRRNEQVNREKSQFFFAPSHIQHRIKEWGAAEFDKRSGSFMMKTAQKSMDWLKLIDVEGLEGLSKVYPDVCEGKLPADQGLIVRMC